MSIERIKKEASELSIYIKSFHGNITHNGEEWQRLQYLRTQILIHNIKEKQKNGNNKK